MSEPWQQSTPGATWVRQYRPTDLADVYDICTRTADGGEDARGKYASDDLMPDIFAGPYVHLEPSLAFVLDHGGRAVGYVIGTADTASFVHRYRREWIPRMSERYGPPHAQPQSPDDEMLLLHYNPERMVVPELNEFPAHLHIDILPPYQGSGKGRQLIATFVSAVAEAGAPGVHVCVLAANKRAVGFYGHVGFTAIDVPDPGPVLYLGRRAVSQP